MILSIQSHKKNGEGSIFKSSGMIKSGLKFPSTVMMSSVELSKERQVKSLLSKFKDSEAIQKFARKYGKPSTKASYLFDLDKYFKWVRSYGIVTSPDKMIEHNLKCIYGSDPTDVKKKRTHTDILDKYVNVKLVEDGLSEASRRQIAAAIRKFYERNDSPLFGDFSVSVQPLKARPKPLRAEDIRKLLKALPIHYRTPLLIVWQSGIEIGRVLSLRWSGLSGIDRGEHPLRFEILGRKKHRKTYCSFVGYDAIEHLKLWKMQWTRLMEREPLEEDLVFMGKGKRPMCYSALRKMMRRMALDLSRQHIIENGNAGSWHPHALRHSFETEASHAGVKAEIRDYFLGHVSGIQWTYNHRDELHPEDLVEEYLRIEPNVSLDYVEATLREEYDNREKFLVDRVIQLERLYEDLKKEVLSKP